MILGIERKGTKTSCCFIGMIKRKERKGKGKGKGKRKGKRKKGKIIYLFIKN